MTLHFFGGSATVPPIFLHLPIVVGQKKIRMRVAYGGGYAAFWFLPGNFRKKTFPPMTLHFFGGLATFPPIILHPIVVGQQNLVCVSLIVVPVR